jgi:hypothetical protein
MTGETGQVENRERNSGSTDGCVPKFEQLGPAGRPTCLAASGAKLVIADVNPGPGWQPVQGTTYFAYDLRH